MGRKQAGTEGMKPKIYLETTIPSLLTARPSRDLVIAADQQVTRDWWKKRHKYDLVISTLVLDEISEGDSHAATARRNALVECRILTMDEAAVQLAEAIMRTGLIPAKAYNDALHVAVAARHGIDFLLTWNCRHLANAAISERVRLSCRKAGYEPPEICTPHNLMAESPYEKPVA
jgi:predicted nucleic acid-binding protein